MRIAIIGAGALGLYYGALLQRAGHELHFLLRSDYEAIVRDGLQVYSPNGDFRLPEVKGYKSTEEMGEVDLVLIGLKTTANAQMCHFVKPLVRRGVPILTLQNGLGNEEILAEAFGPDDILGGTAFLCSNRGKSGEVRHLDYGPITIGSHTGGHSDLLPKLAKLFANAGIPCTVTSNLKQTRWQKLVWNIPFNGLCAHCLVTTSLLLENHGMRMLVQQLMLEVIAAANADLGGTFIAQEFADQMIASTQKMADYRPSMMVDREEGRALEIEAIYRIPLLRGEATGIAMSRTAMLADLLTFDGDRLAR